jgi:hypothetical protein
MIIPPYNVTINPTPAAAITRVDGWYCFYFSIKIFHVHATRITAAAATAATVD